MSLESIKISGLLYISSITSATGSSDPPNKSIMVLWSKAALFLLMKRKSESISTDILARRDEVYIPASEKSLSFLSSQRGYGMNNVGKSYQHGEFNLLYLEPIKHIKIISDLYPSDRILVYDELGTNPLQKYCFRQKRVHAVRVVIKV